ncbi:MAG: hypothetical protein RL230_2352 [Pseudomonadota bacterium]
MDQPYLLSEAQMRRIEPFFPLSHGIPRVDAHGIPRVDDQLIVSAIIFVIKNGLRWRDRGVAVLDRPRTNSPSLMRLIINS